MTEFKIHPAAKNLQPYIQGYLEADSRTSLVKGTHTLFPNGFSGIFFNYGNLGKLLIKEEYTTPLVSIFGQIDQRFDAIHWPGSYSLGVLLKPTVLSKYLHEDMAGFKNKTFDGSLFNKNLLLLHEQIGENASIKQKIGLLNIFFTHAFSHQFLSSTFVDYAVQIMQQGIHGSIKDLSHHLKVSERHLEAQFKKLVGLTPKTYSLIVRFKRVEHKLYQHSLAIPSQFDFFNEYYDQNHFIKEFKRFTGHTPSEYLLRNFSMGRSYLVS
ncbi:MAG TPA: helix-turn-helix domain-containing protein [Cyclobacteriaceae bacterium]|nr:helix-turn-helix domain-containing protein [Cyclobacteriaceae bacterium]HPW62246.1 helix-turn-helix domain-containing protein [Cyclobacteriaceae bacterium]